MRGGCELRRKVRRKQERLTILVHGSLTDHLATVVEKSLTELLSEDVLLTEFDRSVVDGVLHVVDLFDRRKAPSSVIEERRKRECER